MNDAFYRLPNVVRLESLCLYVCDDCHITICFRNRLHVNHVLQSARSDALIQVSISISLGARATGLLALLRRRKLTLNELSLTHDLPANTTRWLRNSRLKIVAMGTLYTHSLWSHTCRNLVHVNIWLVLHILSASKAGCPHCGRGPDCIPQYRRRFIFYLC